MNKYFDINEQGYSIRCKVYFNKDIKDVKNVVIATYGFGGNKDNKAIEKFADRLISKYKSFGVVCFDWPCHGADARNKLILAECVSYMDMVLNYVKNELKAEKVYNYSASFGAYITLEYLHRLGENPFEKIAFRCAAIKMYEAMAQGVSDEEWTKLNKGKEIIRGFERKMKLTKEFFDEMQAMDVTAYDFMDYADDMLMLHGTKDEMVPIVWAEEFSENNIIELIPVEGAEHPFSNPKHMDFAIQKIIEFFA